MSPRIDLFVLLLQVALLAATVRFAWQAWKANQDLRELTAAAADLAGELREAVAAGDRAVSQRQIGCNPPEREGEPSRAELVVGLARLGLAPADIASRMGISRAEADLLAKVGGQQPRKGRVEEC